MGAASPPVEHRAPPVDGGGGHQHSERKHGTLPHLRKVAPGTEDSGPWGDGPWPPMAGEAVVVWEPRKQHCHPCWQDQAKPTHCTDLGSEDFRGFLEILEDSWGLSRSLKSSNATLTNVSKSLKPKGQPTNLNQPDNPTDLVKSKQHHWF